MRSRRIWAFGFVCTLVVAAPAVWAQDVCDGVSEVDNSIIDSVVVATGLDDPLLITAPPGDTDRIFIVGQNGVISVKHRGSSAGDHSVFLDIDARVNSIGNEQGLLSMVFDPDWATNGFFYVDYINLGSDTVVSRFEIDAGDPNVADSTSEVILMVIDQPQSNHNGGYLEFGPDGYLYIGTGDGGGADDEHGACGNGQNNQTLLGKILRIDPSETATGDPDCGSGPYTVPDNLLVDGPGGDCDEIWAWGLRNPWRFNFDSETDDLYVADVGQLCWEEINFVDPAAAASGRLNFGWRQMEGTACFDHFNPTNCAPVSTPDCLPACNDSELRLPVLEYTHSASACSITGGPVYRGCRMPNFRGRYFYGDYCGGTILSMEVVGGAATNLQNWTFLVGGPFPFDLTSFGFDAQGEVYFADRDGEIRKIVPPLTDLEVSGNGVSDPDQFLLHPAGNWTWEDLEFNSMYPIEYYRVYRGVPNGTFDCIHSTLTNDWDIGDLVDPVPGELLAYIVTAVNTTDETSSGNPPRTLANPCGAP